MISLHKLPKLKKAKKRVGRGGKRGNYSGRGIKGQKSRAGRKMRPAMRDIIKSIPKLKGVKFKARKSSVQILNISSIIKKFKEGDVVTPQTLKKRGLVESASRPVKILGNGRAFKALRFKGVLLSRPLRDALSKATSSTVKQKAAKQKTASSSSVRRSKSPSEKTGKA